MAVTRRKQPSTVEPMSAESDQCCRPHPSGSGTGRAARLAEFIKQFPTVPHLAIGGITLEHLPHFGTPGKGSPFHRRSADHPNRVKSSARC